MTNNLPGTSKHSALALAESESVHGQSSVGEFAQGAEGAPAEQEAHQDQRLGLTADERSNSVSAPGIKAVGRRGHEPGGCCKGPVLLSPS